MKYMNETLGNKKLKPVTLVVLGPHRSGTSALTGVLGQLGANLPKHLMPANDGNSSGYFESSRVKSFNDRLLSDLGSSWDDISALDLDIFSDQVRESFLDEAVEILKTEFIDARIPVLKDPRICRLVDFWREAIDRFGYRPIYIHTHRNPLETACSLAARHPISVEMGALIWLRHVLDAEAATRNEPRAFTNYQALLKNWRAQVSMIEAATGFGFHRKTPPIQQEIDTFLSKNLRHQTHQLEDMRRSAQVADLVSKAFEIFEGWKDGISNPADYPRLDMLRTRLDGSVGAIAPFVQMLKRDNTTRQTLEARFAKLEKGTVEIEAERSRLTAELDRLREDGVRRDANYIAQLSNLEGELRQHRLEAKQWFDTNCQLKNKIEGLQTENLLLVEKAEAERPHFENEIRSRDDAVGALKESLEERFREIARISERMLKISQQAEQRRAENLLLKKSLDSLRQEARNSNKRVDELLSSTSWRITGPFRRLVSLIRRWG